MQHCDAIVDLQSGDTGKGKVTHSLLSINQAKPNPYDLVLRYNGGSNAGHTIYHDGKKIVTHQVPAGVFYGIRSLIGIGCVVNIPKLEEEITYLNQLGFNTEGLVLVDKRAHVVTTNHLREDGTDTAIGTTRQGIGPAYRDKYGRKGIRMQDFNYTGNMFSIVDSLQVFKDSDCVLAEGAQGFQLDVDWGDYPYVTSSHCTIGSVVLNGISPKKIRKVYGVAKAYETYVGAKPFGESDKDRPYFEQIASLGQEFGATTGRPRKVNWINLDQLKQAIAINDVTDLIINKFDILQTVGVFGYIENGKVEYVDTAKQFETLLLHYVFESGRVTISRSPEYI